MRSRKAQFAGYFRRYKSRRTIPVYLKAEASRLKWPVHGGVGMVRF